MKLHEAVAAIAAGHKVRASSGAVFWLEKDAKGRPVLAGEPKGYGKPVKHLVLASEHFDESVTWEVVADQ